MNTEIIFPKSTLMAMIIMALICVVVPFIIMAVIKKKTGAYITSFLYGMGIYLIFAFGVQGLLNILLFNLIGLGGVLTKENHPVWYALYGAVVLGIIEECAKYVGLRYAMKKRLDTGNVLMYGLGHAGFTSIAYGGSMLMGNAALAVMVNSMGFDGYISKLNLGAEEAQAFKKSVTELSRIPSSEHITDGIQSIMYLFMQVALTIFVYCAIKGGKCFKGTYYLPIAIAVHIVGYIPYYLYQMDVIKEPMISLVLMSVVTMGTIFYAHRIVRFLY